MGLFNSLAEAPQQLRRYSCGQRAQSLGRFLGDYGLMRDVFKPLTGTTFALGAGGGPSDWRRFSGAPAAHDTRVGWC
jgi:hypothetical protein